MKRKLTCSILVIIFFSISSINAQESKADSLLTLDRIFKTREFRQEYQRPIQWIENGNSYITIERSEIVKGSLELIKWNSKTQKKEILIPAEALIINEKSLYIESFTLSPDGSKVLIFTNSKPVWRSNTKGDYWVFDIKDKNLKQLGKTFEASSLMFAKFSSDNEYVAYVQNFNIYIENYKTGVITQLTSDGTKDIINGTFDWVYEEEFGKRDGFKISPNDEHIAFWQIDASGTGVFYMINNTDSNYSKPIPVQYPKIGQSPSKAKIGIVNLSTKDIIWLPLHSDEDGSYIPGMQWVNKDLLLIQQLNRKQNILNIWSYQISTKKLKKVYTEEEDTWIEINYPDVSANWWSGNELFIVDDGKAFLRMNENDGWRHIYKVNIETGQKILTTPGKFDAASLSGTGEKSIYFIASPQNSTQRYLYSADQAGKGILKRITPEKFSGLNNYDISPNGKFAIHTHQSTIEARTVSLLSLPDHKILKNLVTNESYKIKLSSIVLPDVKFMKVKTEDSIEIDARVIFPTNFNPDLKYPVLFHVYGEPWQQTAIDRQIGMWNIFLAQNGYVIIDMDNRGTPCLKGSKWRKSIYGKVGVINTRDQAMAAKEILKLNYLDNDRTAVWGWSGGGTMTLNLMFRYPEIYKTGMAVAAVSDHLVYDNVYQERYMGILDENREEYETASPVNHAKNLEGNLLIVHGTADDNVHYQSAELLINELIKHNKQFQIMPYPNRAHSIYKGANTRRHLFTLLTNYLFEHTPPNK